MKTPAFTLAITTCLLSAGIFSLPAAHASDYKGISSASCQPYGPSTLISDLALTNNGIRNISGSVKQVICPVNKDFFGTWDDDNPAQLTAYYKTGAQPGQMWCTSFVGGPASFGSGTYSNTGASGPRPAATIGTVGIQLRDPPGGILVIENANVLCSLTPGVLFGGLFFMEPDDTDGSGS